MHHGHYSAKTKAQALRHGIKQDTLKKSQRLCLRDNTVFPLFLWVKQKR